MPYYTLSPPVIERSPPLVDNSRTLGCLSCGDTMKHLRTIPKLGVRSEKLIFAPSRRRPGRSLPENTPRVFVVQFVSDAFVREADELSPFSPGSFESR
jgi:hypothetical protein